MKSIEGYNARYSVDENGVIYSSANPSSKNRILKPTLCTDGYMRIGLYAPDGTRKMVAVHRIVAFSYLGVPHCDSMVVNHINGNKTDNRLLNLEWVTKQGNSIHAFENGLLKFPTSRHDISAKAIEMRRDGKKIREIADFFGVSNATAHKWSNTQTKGIL